MYTHESWAAHRSVNRYWRHFMGLFRSRIVAGIARPLLIIFLEATAVCVYESLLKAGALPAFCRSIQGGWVVRCRWHSCCGRLQGEHAAPRLRHLLCCGVPSPRRPACA